MPDMPTGSRSEDGQRPGGAMVGPWSATRRTVSVTSFSTAQKETWGTGSGGRRRAASSRESIAECAARELVEETGVVADPEPVATENIGWAVFILEVPWGTRVRLSHEHDDFAWVSQDEAMRRCRPERQAASFRLAMGAIDARRRP